MPDNWMVIRKWYVWTVVERRGADGVCVGLSMSVRSPDECMGGVWSVVRSSVTSSDTCDVYGGYVPCSLGFDLPVYACLQLSTRWVVTALSLVTMLNLAMPPVVVICRIVCPRLGR